MTGDLIKFLTDRLDEDERDALAGRGIFPRPAVTDDGGVCLHVKPGGNMAVTWYRNPVDGYKDMADLRNWAETENGWTRERVLTEVALKRQMIDLLFRHASKIDDEWGCGCKPERIRAGECPETSVDEMEGLRILAAAWAEHPAYREGWRP